MKMVLITLRSSDADGYQNPHTVRRVLQEIDRCHKDPTTQRTNARANMAHVTTHKTYARASMATPNRIASSKTSKGVNSKLKDRLHANGVSKKCKYCCVGSRQDKKVRHLERYCAENPVNKELVCNKCNKQGHTAEYCYVNPKSQKKNDNNDPSNPRANQAKERDEDMDVVTTDEDE